MEPGKTLELKTALITDVNPIYTVWCDSELWGYSSTLEDVKVILDNIAQNIIADIKKRTPHLSVECVNEDNLVKIKCLDPGYLYNSTWDAHVLRYGTLHKLKIERKCKRAPSFETIETVDKFVNPITRPPTPPLPPPPPPKTLNKRKKKKRHIF